MENLDHLREAENDIENNSLRLIDIKNNKECWFQCLFSYSVFYKTPIQILKNQFIINRLTSIDASTIGAVCGETYKDYLKYHKFLKHPAPIIEKNNNLHCYKLLFIKRDGSIEYETTNLERFSEKNILNFAKNKTLMRNFSSLEAYYIGFLAGLELYKIKRGLNPKKHNRRSKLELIYSNPNLSNDP